RLGFDDSSWKADYISYYYAAGNALLIQRWIRGGFIVPPEELASLYNRMSTPYWVGMAGADNREGL
ncbi:MAG: TetR-like C-terminal domain-containing protein, partial [Eggerthellales bacterium]|nr:TetR-like C-terminal domain-containing protein [Eggerthellales bacterium]